VTNSRDWFDLTNSRDWFDLHFGDITYGKNVCTLRYFNSRVTTRYILVTAMFPIAARDSIILHSCYRAASQ
jgi:hypothetical protein